MPTDALQEKRPDEAAEAIVYNLIGWLRAIRRFDRDGDGQMSGVSCCSMCPQVLQRSPRDGAGQRPGDEHTPG